MTFCPFSQRSTKLFQEAIYHLTWEELIDKLYTQDVISFIMINIMGQDEYYIYFKIRLLAEYIERNLKGRLKQFI